MLLDFFLLDVRSGQVGWYLGSHNSCRNLLLECKYAQCLQQGKCSHGTFYLRAGLAISICPHELYPSLSLLRWNHPSILRFRWAALECRLLASPQMANSWVFVRQTHLLSNCDSQARRGFFRYRQSAAWPHSPSSLSFQLTSMIWSEYWWVCKTIFLLLPLFLCCFGESSWSHY